MLKKFKERFIGDKDFYKMVLMVATPMMIQNGITNFVSLLDNDENYNKQKKEHQCKIEKI